jgi:NADH:ubiquinone oxidoreductase subunit F (NADH-binding)
MMDFINNYGKGVKGGRLKAVIPGGSSCPVLTAEECQDLTLTYESMRDHKTMFGTGCAIIMNENTDMVKVLKNLTHFYAHESCGQCTPCRVGSEKAAKLMAKGPWDVSLLTELSTAMRDASICGLGQAAPNPLLCVLKFFPEELSKPLGSW